MKQNMICTDTNFQFSVGYKLEPCVFHRFFSFLVLLDFSSSWVNHVLVTLAYLTCHSFFQSWWSPTRIFSIEFLNKIFSPIQHVRGFASSNMLLISYLSISPEMLQPYCTPCMAPQDQSSAPFVYYLSCNEIMKDFTFFPAWKIVLIEFPN